MHITPGKIDRFSLGHLSLDFYTTFEGTIYANNQGTLMKLSGDHFVRVNHQEEQRFRIATRGMSPDFTDVDGWSKKYSVLNRSFEGEDRFPIKIGGKPLTILVKHGHKHSDVSIELLRPGQPPEQLLYANEWPRRVTKAEYETLFGQR
jgi:hypothetical protein